MKDMVAKQFINRLLKLTAIWVVAFVLCQPFRLYFHNLFFSLLVGFLWLAGFLLVPGLLFSLRNKDQRLFTLTLLLLSVFILHLFYFYGERLSILTYFFLHKSQYEAVVASVSAAPTCSPNKLNLTGWRIECEPRRQVAFLLPGAKAYQWQGIVYGLPDNTYAKRFGNDLIATEHQYGNWYLCTFTS